MVYPFEGASTGWCLTLISKSRLLVMGAGGDGRLVVESAEMSFFNVLGFLDYSFDAQAAQAAQAARG